MLVRKSLHYIEPGITVDVLTEVGQFERLRSDWDDLFGRAGKPHQLFQRHSFLAHWARHYLTGGSRLQVVAVREGGRLVMALPLVRTSLFGVNVFTFMGQPISQFDDVLVDTNPSRAAVDAAWQAVRDLGADVLFTRNVRGDSALAQAIPEGLQPVELAAASAPCADLSERVAGDGPSERYSSKYRSNHRRRLRRLLEHGETRFIGDEGAADRTALVARAMDLKRNSLGRRPISRSPVFEQRFEDFFVGLARDPGNESELRLSAIEIDGQPVAIDLSFDCMGRSFGFLTVYDASFSAVGAGTVLLHHVFATARERGNAALEMLAPADAYKLQHADGMIGVVDHAVAFSAQGRAVIEADRRIIRPAKRFARKTLSGLAAAFPRKAVQPVAA